MRYICVSQIFTFVFVMLLQWTHNIGSFVPVSYAAVLETSFIYCIHFSLSPNCISHQILSIKAHNWWLLPKVLPKPIWVWTTWKGATYTSVMSAQAVCFLPNHSGKESVWLRSRKRKIIIRPLDWVFSLPGRRAVRTSEFSSALFDGL